MSLKEEFIALVLDPIAIGGIFAGASTSAPNGLQVFDAALQNTVAVDWKSAPNFSANSYTLNK